MKLAGWTLLGLLVVTGAAATWASYHGTGLPRPEKEPISVREGSTRGAQRSGHLRTRYFVGGGIHRGK